MVGCLSELCVEFVFVPMLSFGVSYSYYILGIFWCCHHAVLRFGVEWCFVYSVVYWLVWQVVYTLSHGVIY